MRSRRQLAGGAIVAVAALAAPMAASAGSAQAAITASGLQRCYSGVPLHQQATITAQFAGGTPGDTFMFIATVPGKGSGSAGSSDGDTTFDALGNGTASITNVFPPGDAIGPLAGRKVNLSVEDFGAAGDVTTQLGSVLISNIALDVSETPRSPRKKRMIKLSGTPFAGKKVYGFVTNKKGTKVLHRFYVGRGNVCGYTKRKTSLFPKHYKRGSYRLYVNAGKKLNKKRALGEKFSITRIF